MLEEYYFQNRAVAFLDVLGFSQKLKEFEAEAKDSHLGVGSSVTSFLENGKLTSQKANEFIHAFKSALSTLDEGKFRFYLFSDNICITSLQETSNEDLNDLLLAINKLFFEFANRGFFLRGGVDYGLFIDEETIAVGLPLAIAYELESKKAIYPRIVLSENLVQQFQICMNDGNKEFENFYMNNLVQESCEIKFLNVFLQVFQSEYQQEKQEFFSKYKEVISENLEENKLKENIYLKYKWLADNFNSFIDLFVEELAYTDPDFDPDDPEAAGFLEFINNQKILLS